MNHLLVDEFLPVFDFSDTIETVVAADATTTWTALVEADLIEVGRRRPLVGLLGAVRILPDLVWQRLHREHPPAAPERLTLRDTKLAYVKSAPPGLKGGALRATAVKVVRPVCPHGRA
jgi:hypothetical protein